MKYPRIAHLPFSNVTDADDIVTTSDVFGQRWILTEKIDGSQMNIEFVDGSVSARNRNTVLLKGGMDAQFSPLPAWIEGHYTGLWELLGNGRILFGEWLFHVHSIHYSCLPDLFIAFDVYSKKDRCFLPFYQAMESCEGFGIRTARVIGDVVLRDEKHLLSFIGKSAYTDGEMEGIVLHSPDGTQRFKYVTPAFKASVDASKHWRECDRTRNEVR